MNELIEGREHYVNRRKIGLPQEEKRKRKRPNLVLTHVQRFNSQLAKFKRWPMNKLIYIQFKTQAKSNHV